MWRFTVSIRPASLATGEGILVSVSIGVEPRRLELLLEALAVVSFPVNPQIYHDAAVVSRYPDGHEESESITLVEFPGYAERMDEVREAIARFGFDPDSIEVTGMLEEISSDAHPEPVPAGAEYVSRYRVKAASVR
jgi:hypothetical protein